MEGSHDIMSRVAVMFFGGGESKRNWGHDSWSFCRESEHEKSRFMTKKITNRDFCFVC